MIINFTQSVVVAAFDICDDVITLTHKLYKSVNHNIGLITLIGLFCKS